MKRLHTTVEEYNMRATSYKSVSGFAGLQIRSERYEKWEFLERQFLIPV